MAGGAINIVTKQATTEKSFYNMDTTFGTDQTKRVTLDVNQVINPTFAIRAGGLFQDANVAGRDCVTDNRDGAFVATTWKPTDAIKITSNYIHTELTGMPDFGVPYYRPSTAIDRRWSVPGLRRQPQQLLRLRQSRLLQDRPGHRHGQCRGPDHARFDAQQQDPGVALDAELHRNAAGVADACPGTPFTAYTLTANPQSRYQVTDVFANQTEATYKFNDCAGFKHTAACRHRISTGNDRRSTNIPG